MSAVCSDPELAPAPMLRRGRRVAVATAMSASLAPRPVQTVDAPGALAAEEPAAEDSCVPEFPAHAPSHWREACAHLMQHDRVMRRLIPQHGSVCLESRGDAFVTLARSIVGQQISLKAAQSVWNRFVGLVGEVSATAVQRLSVDQLRQAGLSARKADYLLDLAQHFSEERLHRAAWQDMGDEAIIAELTSVRGIGRWTAEMFLMFHLMRPNVLPLDDAGLVKGISHNYFSGEPVTRNEMREVADAWAPYCSVATWYVWRSMTPLPVAY